MTYTRSAGRVLSVEIMGAQRRATTSLELPTSSVTLIVPSHEAERGPAASTRSSIEPPITSAAPSVAELLPGARSCFAVVPLRRKTRTGAELGENESVAWEIDVV